MSSVRVGGTKCPTRSDRRFRPTGSDETTYFLNDVKAAVNSRWISAPTASPRGMENPEPPAATVEGYRRPKADREGCGSSRRRLFPVGFCQIKNRPVLRACHPAIEADRAEVKLCSPLQIMAELCQHVRANQHLPA